MRRWRSDRDGSALSRGGGGCRYRCRLSLRVQGRRQRTLVVGRRQGRVELGREVGERVLAAATAACVRVGPAQVVPALRWRLARARETRKAAEHRDEVVR